MGGGGDRGGPKKKVSSSKKHHALKPSDKPPQEYPLPVVQPSKRLKTDTKTLFDSVSAIRRVGSTSFRSRLVLSVLSQRAVIISKIREDSENPGMNANEVAFSRLIAQVANGSWSEINETGTRMHFKPGVPTGGKVSMRVPEEVDMGWMIEGLLPLVAFCKTPLEVEITGGITDGNEELGVDLLRAVGLRVLEKFGLPGAAIKCNVRGYAPEGGGAVYFTAPVIRKHLVVPADLGDDQLRVAKIRGVAHSAKVNPQMANRVATQARSELEKFAPDVFINTDCRSSKTGDAGSSPGYGLTLWAELVNPEQAKHQAIVQIASVTGASGTYVKDDTPEGTGLRVSRALFAQIANHGSVDITHQSLMIMLMALCPEQVVRVNFGKTLSEHAIGTLREVKEFLGITFKIASDSQTKIINLTCVGNGVGNFARKVT